MVGTSHRIGRGGAVLVLGAVLVAGLVSAPAAAAATARSVSAKASVASLTIGAKVTFSGKVSRSPKGSAVYVQRLAGSKWTTVAKTKTTTAAGAYKVAVTDKTAGHVAFRVYAPKTSKLAAAASAKRYVDGYQVAKAALTGADVTATAGHNTATVTGKVSPFKAGTKVTLQRLNGTAWANVSTTTVSKTGTFSKATNAVANGTSAKFRFVVAQVKYLRQAVTGARTVTVQAPTLPPPDPTCAPLPAVIAVTPASAGQYDPTTVTISGNGFIPATYTTVGSGTSVSWTSTTTRVLWNGTAIGWFDYTTHTTTTMTFPIPTTDAAGPVSVVLTNGSCAAATLTFTYQPEVKASVAISAAESYPVLVTGQTVPAGTALTSVPTGSATPVVTVSGLPAGVTYNAATGTLAGKPTASPGGYAVTVTAKVTIGKQVATQTVRGYVVVAYASPLPVAATPAQGNYPLPPGCSWPYTEDCMTQYINLALTIEGYAPTFQLPADYDTLSPSGKLVEAVTAMRAAYGLSPLIYDTSGDNAAQLGAKNGVDPIADSGMTWSHGWASNWAGGQATPLEA
ncbi:MAG: hypothetical protein FWD74_06210, partial [Actinomycetia bacterium]|nr:hypothetical protein [Actinomycetes bacterium]